MSEIQFIKWVQPNPSMKPRQICVRRFPNLSHRELFANIDKHLEGLTELEKTNLYFTMNYCEEGKDRKFLGNNLLMIDIDYPIQDRLDEYHGIVCEVFGVNLNKTVVINSGNGLQYAILRKDTFKEEGSFKATREWYKDKCNQVNRIIQERGLVGEKHVVHLITGEKAIKTTDCDTAVWDHRRVMRVPNTINHKTKWSLPPVATSLIQGILIPQSVNMTSTQVSDVQKVQTDDAPVYGKPDHEFIMSGDGCRFLHWAQNNQNKVSEALWYKSLTVVGRLDKSGALAHKFSDQFKGYTYEETEEKLEQALDRSGPLTCQHFNEISDKCKACPHFGKVTSPIRLKGPDFISTGDTGYHVKGKSGWSPEYEDLYKQWQKETTHLVVADSSIPYVWKDNHWREMDMVEIDSYCDTRMTMPHIHRSIRATNAKKAEFRGTVLCRNLVKRDHMISARHNKMNFQNGVLTFEQDGTWSFENHAEVDTKHYYFTAILPYSYDPAAECPRFIQFMSEISCGDKEIEALLLEFMGYCLSGDDPRLISKFLLLFGDGSNGKSTFMNVLTSLAGQDNYSTIDMKSLQYDQHRAMLENKLFNLSEETPTSAMEENNVLKNLVTGGEVTVKTVYQKPYTIRNTAKMVFACNKLPRTFDTSIGNFRRMVIVPFNANFENSPNKDVHIDRKLAAERSGIINVVLKAYQAMKKRGHLTPSSACREALNEYMEENNPMLEWLMETGIEFSRSEQQPISMDSLYSDYRNFMLRQGLKFIPPKVAFSKTFKVEMERRIGKDILEEYGMRTRFRVGNVTKRGYKNIVFNPSSPEGLTYP